MMNIASNLVLSLALILDFFDLSFQFDCLPNGAPIPYSPRSRTTRSPERSLRLKRSHSHTFPETSVPSAGPPPVGIPEWSSLPAEHLLPARDRSPHARKYTPRILGFDLEELKFVWLIPFTNPSQRFKIQSFTFPRDKPIQLRTGNNSFAPMPTEERMVLATANGDIFAILERRNTKLRGIFRSDVRNLKRAKINMHTGEVTDMTPDEMDESQLGSSNPISKRFDTIVVNEIEPQH